MSDPVAVVFVVIVFIVVVFIVVSSSVDPDTHPDVHLKVSLPSLLQ